VDCRLVLTVRIRSSNLYRRVLPCGGSAAIALSATAWMIERSFDVKVLSL